MAVLFNISWYKIILPTDKFVLRFTYRILLSKNYNIIFSLVDMGNIWVPLMNWYFHPKKGQIVRLQSDL